jgi:hypothetical protein
VLVFDIQTGEQAGSLGAARTSGIVMRAAWSGDGRQVRPLAERIRAAGV